MKVNEIKISRWSIVGVVLAAAIVCAGCDSGNQFTPAQEQAARHPVADPNLPHGMTSDQRSKMAQAMEKSRQDELKAPPVKFTNQ